MRLVLGAAVAVVVGVGVYGVVMQATAAERVAMGFIFGLMAAGTVAAAIWLPKLAKGNRSLRTTLMSLSIISFLIVVFGLLAAGQQMFISTHDLTLLLIVIGFGIVAATAFAFLVSAPLTGELSQIAETATAIADGDLSRRTDIARSDEVGELAEAVDHMALALEAAEVQRDADDRARREFFAAVGHDLRTPLASLQVALEAVQDGMTDEPDRYLDSMHRDADALSRLVDDLFLMARLESGDIAHDMATVDLAEVADEAMEVLAPICDEREIDVVLQADRRVEVSASTQGMSRVMRNLLDNAVRHSPDGGTVTINISNGRSGVVVISDEGLGFAPEFVDSAFNRLTRYDDDRSRASGGAGLGLAIAQRYVEDFGGRIWADPGPGGQISFEVPI